MGDRGQFLEAHGRGRAPPWSKPDVSLAGQQVSEVPYHQKTSEYAMPYGLERMFRASVNSVDDPGGDPAREMLGSIQGKLWEDDSAVSRLMPWIYSKNPNVQYNVLTMDAPSITAQRVPHGGIARLISTRRSPVTAQMERRGLALTIERDVLSSGEGPEALSRAIDAIAACVSATVAYDALAAVVDHGRSSLEFANKQGGGGGLQGAGVLQAMQTSVQDYACLQRDSFSLYGLTKRGQETVGRGGHRADVVVLPPGASSYVAMQRPEMYGGFSSGASEAARTNLANAGLPRAKQPRAHLGGCDVYEPPYIAVSAIERASPLVRDSEVGEFHVFSAAGGIMFYDEEKDDMVPLTAADMQDQEKQNTVARESVATWASDHWDDLCDRKPPVDREAQLSWPDPLVYACYEATGDGAVKRKFDSAFVLFGNSRRAGSIYAHVPHILHLAPSLLMQHKRRNNYTENEGGEWAKAESTVPLPENEAESRLPLWMQTVDRMRTYFNTETDIAEWEVVTGGESQDREDRFWPFGIGWRKHPSHSGENFSWEEMQRLHTRHEMIGGDRVRKHLFRLFNPAGLFGRELKGASSAEWKECFLEMRTVEFTLLVVLSRQGSKDRVIISDGLLLNARKLYKHPTTSKSKDFIEAVGQMIRADKFFRITLKQSKGTFVEAENLLAAAEMDAVSKGGGRRGDVLTSSHPDGSTREVVVPSDKRPDGRREEVHLRALDFDHWKPSKEMHEALMKECGLLGKHRDSLSLLERAAAAAEAAVAAAAKKSAQLAATLQRSEAVLSQAVAARAASEDAARVTTELTVHGQVMAALRIDNARSPSAEVQASILREQSNGEMLLTKASVGRDRMAATEAAWGAMAASGDVSSPDARLCAQQTQIVVVDVRGRAMEAEEERRRTVAAHQTAQTSVLTHSGRTAQHENSVRLHLREFFVESTGRVPTDKDYALALRADGGAAAALLVGTLRQQQESPGTRTQVKDDVDADAEPRRRNMSAEAYEGVWMDELFAQALRAEVSQGLCLALMRPRITHKMGTVVVAKGGGAVGATLQGTEADMKLQMDDKKLYGNFTFYSKAHVRDSTAFSLHRDVFTAGYKTGCGSKCLVREETGGRSAGKLTGDCVCTVVAARMRGQFPCLAGESVDGFVDITGLHGPEVHAGLHEARDRSRVGVHLSCGPLVYARLQGWETLGPRLDYMHMKHGGKEFNKQTMLAWRHPGADLCKHATNTVLYRGSDIVRASMLRPAARRGVGHWGSFAYPGAACVRRGGFGRMDSKRQLSSDANAMENSKQFAQGVTDWLDENIADFGEKDNVPDEEYY